MSLSGFLWWTIEMITLNWKSSKLSEFRFILVSEGKATLSQLEMENLPHSSKVITQSIVNLCYPTILPPVPVTSTSTRKRFFIILFTSTNHHHHHKLVSWHQHPVYCCIQSCDSPVRRGFPSTLMSSPIEETAFTRTVMNPNGLDWYKISIFQFKYSYILFLYITLHIYLCLNHLNIQLVLETNC